MYIIPYLYETKKKEMTGGFYIEREKWEEKYDVEYKKKIVYMQLYNNVEKGCSVEWDSVT
jgi:hypothetical protein